MNKFTRIVAVCLLMAMLATLMATNALAAAPDADVLIGAANEVETVDDAAAAPDAEDVNAAPEEETGDEPVDAAAEPAQNEVASAPQKNKAQTRYVIVGGIILGVCALAYVGISVATKKKSKKSN